MLAGVPFSATRHPLPDSWQSLWEGFERHLLIQNRTERTLNGYQESVSSWRSIWLGRSEQYVTSCCSSAASSKASS